MLPFFDDMLSDRTGINDASAGLAPDALQNMTAKGAAMMEQGGIARTELMIRNIASGLREAFQGLYRLMIKHPDQPRMVRLKGEMVQIDPRQWNENMDVTVNVGLGAGSRERDLMALTAIEQTQAMIATQGPHLGIVTPDNIYSTAIAKTAAAGMKSPQRFFSKPQEGASLIPPQGPDPEMTKLQAQMQLEQAKMEAQRDKEAAQGEADVVVAQAKAEIERENADREAQIKIMEIESRERIELAKLAQERELAMMQAEAQAITAMAADGAKAESGAKDQMLLESMALLRQAISDPKPRRRFVVSRDPMTGDMMGVDEADGDEVRS